MGVSPAGVPFGLPSDLDNPRIIDLCCVALAVDMPWVALESCGAAQMPT
jgi:hypothetical protein